MPNRSRRHPNALRHGMYAEPAFLPGEDPEEFTKLYSRLIDEWKPVGPTEEDAVLSVATGMWRKRRVQKYLETKIMKCRCDPEHDAYDEHAILSTFRKLMKLAPDLVPQSLSKLSPDTSKYLLDKFPLQGSVPTPEWIEAIDKEITTYIRSGMRLGPQVPFDSALILSEHDLIYELQLNERIEAMIDRAIKRLVQTKAMKEVMGSTFRNRGDHHPKKRGQRRKPNGSAKAGNNKRLPPPARP